jgi:methionine sulfoxide reductase catalytic subunit
MSRLPKEPPAAEITPEALYQRRRDFLKNTALFAGTAAALGTGLLRLVGGSRATPPVASAEPLPVAIVPPAPPAPSASAELGAPLTDEKTPFEAITTYNNYYELGLSKTEPAKNGHLIRPRPWTIKVEGEVKKNLTLDIDTLLRWFPVEERVYRMRCVEAWSMVIPWLGFPLGALIKRLEPTSRAKYVAFTTLLDEEQLPGQASSVLDWPYREGLRMDEATHPLALLAVGLYGKSLLGQNGAPIRLVVPWKYGFKGVKSIVHIRFAERKPETSWNIADPKEYGFYANVNPAVDHPRWTQANERRIGELRRRDTLPFNGYAEQVASLYTGMDLKENF